MQPVESIAFAWVQDVDVLRLWSRLETFKVGTRYGTYDWSIAMVGLEALKFEVGGTFWQLTPKRGLVENPPSQLKT